MSTKISDGSVCVVRAQIEPSLLCPKVRGDGRWWGLEVILTFALGGTAKVDGVLGAAVIAAHAIGAMTVPVGAVILYCDVLERTVLCADSTTYALVRYGELAVGNEQAVKEGL